jgi:hypothetical protein
MTSYDGQEAWTSVSAEKLGQTVVYKGTARPVGAANKIPQYGIFIEVDSLTAPTTRTWYIQTSATISSPSFIQIPDPADSQTLDSVWGVNADQTIETCATYANTTEGDADYVPSHTTNNFVRLNPTTDVIDGTFTVAAAAHCYAYRDLIGMAISDTSWILRFKLTTVSITNPTAGLSHSIYIGFSSNTSNMATSQDFLGLGLWNLDTAVKKYYVEARDAAIGGVATGTTSQVFTRTWSAETVYVKIVRISSTTLRITLYSDSTYVTVLETQLMSIPNTIQGLRYFKIGNYDNANVAGWVITVDDIQFRDGAISF